MEESSLNINFLSTFFISIYAFHFIDIFTVSKNYVLEVGNLGDTEAADTADFNVLEVPPGGVAESSPSHPDSLVFWRPMLIIHVCIWSFS